MYRKNNQRSIRTTLLYIAILLIYSNLTITQSARAQHYLNPDKYPTFIYKSNKDTGSSLKEFFHDYYKIPKELEDNCYSGTIYVQLTVNIDSTVSSIKIIRGIDPKLDNSVVELLKKAHGWSPASVGNKIITAQTVIPIKLEWLY